MVETATLSGSVVGALQRGPEESVTLSGRLVLPAPSPEEWDRLIDGPLIDWGREPERYSDDGVEPPTARAIRRASGLVKDLRRAQWPLLPRLVMSGEGGIVFDWALGNMTLSMEISGEGELELLLFDGCRVVQRF
ncbi:MAG: hypothetical protein HY721_27075 [Planctomycetes bacterium]|nr:hypothetical protein [Planctomycetota bacterium]